MQRETIIKNIIFEFTQGKHLAKCRKCGCMHEALESLRAAPMPQDFLRMVETSQSNLETREYNCLGCEHCYPAVIMNLLHQAFPEQSASFSPPCSWEVGAAGWPPIPGEYFALCEGAHCPVAVSTLASPELAESLARMKPPGLCIVGKTETENVGIDKIIKNSISAPSIRFLLLTGLDADGHFSGKTLLSLSDQGVDGDMRVIGSPGRRPVLANVTAQEVEAFRRQVNVVDMIGCQDLGDIITKIEELAQVNPPICTCSACGPETPLVPGVQARVVPVIQAEKCSVKKLDKAGYFVILTQPEQKIIIVEHYSYENRLLRVIEGNDPGSICATIIENGWITELSHASYLGRELMLAKLSMEMGFKFIQDGA